MLRHPRLIAVCACIVASVGCDDGKLTTPAPPSSSSSPSPSPGADPTKTVTVEFGGRVVNADAGGAVESVRVSLHSWGPPGGGLSTGGAYANDEATSRGDGTFTLPLNLPIGWRSVYLKLTGPPGYEDTYQAFRPDTATERPAIRMYPTLVIRPGESIDVRVDYGIVWCGWDSASCRRVLVEASPGNAVDLEIVSHDSSNPMALGLARIPEDSFILEPDMSVRRLMVPPGGVPYVLADRVGTARLTARR